MICDGAQQWTRLYLLVGIPGPEVLAANRCGGETSPPARTRTARRCGSDSESEGATPARELQGCMSAPERSQRSRTNTRERSSLQGGEHLFDRAGVEPGPGLDRQPADDTVLEDRRVAL